MALCANFCATNMDPRFMALEDFSKLFQVPHPLRHFNCQWGPQRFRRWSFLGTKRFLIIFRFSQGGWIPIIGELFDTGVVSAIRDWKIVIDSIMATPRRENLSTNTHVLWGLEDISTVKNCLESSSGAWEPWRKKSSFPIEKVGSGRVQLRQWRTGRRTKGRKCAHATVAKLPIKGLSLVIGIISDTVFRNIVRERRIVTPENQTFIFTIILMK